MADKNEENRHGTAKKSSHTSSSSIPPYMKAMSGSLGGIVEACCLQPIDVIKTRLQLDRSNAYKGIAHCGSTVARTEGVRALWKGLTPFATHLTLKYTLRMGSNALLQSAFKDSTTGHLSNRGRLMAGFGAGVLEALVIVTPFEPLTLILLHNDPAQFGGQVCSKSVHHLVLPGFWNNTSVQLVDALEDDIIECSQVVKIRLQQQKGLSPELLKYKGPIHCARMIVREEGLLGLWAGAAPTVMRNGTNQAAMFTAKNAFDGILWQKHEGDGQVLQPWQSMVSGFLAGTAGPVCTGPFDVVKTRLMAQSRSGGEVKYKGMFHAIRTIYTEEGLLALWKGLLPRLMRIPPGQAIMWAVADQSPRNILFLFVSSTLGALVPIDFYPLRFSDEGEDVWRPRLLFWSFQSFVFRIPAHLEAFDVGVHRKVFSDKCPLVHEGESHLRKLGGCMAERDVIVVLKSDELIGGSVMMDLGVSSRIEMVEIDRGCNLVAGVILMIGASGSTDRMAKSDRPDGQQQMAAYERPWKNAKSGVDDQQRGGGDLAREEKETYLNGFLISDGKQDVHWVMVCDNWWFMR
ncbi:hypothetical protein ACLOJK_023578 [Asimina triloba]